MGGDAAVDAAISGDMRDANMPSTMTDGGAAYANDASQTDADSPPTPQCGDGHVDANEQCDDGNTVTERCDYGVSECTVCDATCHYHAGVAKSCGDGQLDTPQEACDDGNTVTEACAYGQTSCSVCGGDCQMTAGAVAFCGDGTINSADGEECDDGNTVANDGCDASCKVEAVASCGNGVLDSGEQCDDSNKTNLDGCNAACKIESGWSCPSTGACHTVCGDGKVVGAEVCDDGNMVDNDYCNNTCTVSHRCGDSVIQGGAGEQCDDGNTVTEACTYGQHSCTVCDATCKNQAGAAAYCGDGVVQASHGEECEPSLDVRCDSNCKISCDTIYITYSLSANFQVTGTTGGLGDTTAAQTGGTMVVAFPAGPTGPVDGTTGGITYLRQPIKMTQNISAISVKVVTDIVGAAGSASNMCPIASGMLVGSKADLDACPYLGKHGTVNWTPSDQSVPAGQGPGCLPYNSSGTVTCTGSFCTSIGLKAGTTTINDTWDQPGAPGTFGNAFSKVSMRAGYTTAQSGEPTDKLEIPNTVPGRTWINFDGTESSRTCAKKPTNCPAPGAQ